MSSSKKIIFEYFFVSLIILLFGTIYLFFQPQIIAGNGYGWDGIHYAEMFKNITNNNNSIIGFPFCNRIGTPLIASFLQINDISLSFKIVNTFFSFIFSVTIYVISRYVGFNIYYSLIALFLTFGLFFSPLRFTPYYPVYSDPAFLALLSIAFLFLIKNKYGLSFFMLFLAYPFREATIYVLPVFLIFAIYLEGINKKTLIKFSISLIGVLLTKIIIINYMDCNGSQLKTALVWLYKGLSNPERFISVIAAISMTAAPLVYINNISNLTKIEKISMIGFLLSVIFAFFGGSDSTRIFYSFFPIYFILIIYIIRNKGYVFSLIILFGYMITNRFATKILEPFNYQPTKDEYGLFWQFPDHARPEIAILILTVWTILFMLYNKFKLNNNSFKKNDSSPL